MPQVPSGYKKVVHLDKTLRNAERFITVSTNRGTQWASCKTGMTEVKDPRFSDFRPNQGRSGDGSITWAQWLFIIPGLGIIAIGAGFIGLNTAPIFAFGISLQALAIFYAGFVATVGAALAGIKLAQLLTEAAVALGTLLPGSRVEFITFEQP